MSQRTYGVITHDAAVVTNFLKFRGGFGALTRCQIYFSAHIDGMETDPANLAKLASSRCTGEENSMER
jgi:hypothetical protein